MLGLFLFVLLMAKYQEVELLVKIGEYKRGGDAVTDEAIDKIDAIRGMDIPIVTPARSDEEGRALLREMGMPFQSN